MISINESLAGKKILITGSTGFLGQHVLCTLLRKIHDIQKIYLISRPSSQHSPQERIENLLYESSLLEDYTNTEIQEFIKKLTILKGDTTHKYWGIKPYTTILKETDLIINCAANVDFRMSHRSAYQQNILSCVHLSEILNEFSNISLVHVSTCFVSGKNPHQTKEKNYKCHLFQNKKHYWQDSQKLRSNFSNSYTWSKYCGEQILFNTLKRKQFCIVRPSIVESTLKYPKKGWMSGVKTTTPICYLALKNTEIYGNKSNRLDIIPVDLVSCSIIAVSATLLNNKHKGVYQCGSSNLNPIYLKNLLSYTYNWLEKNHTLLSKKQMDNDNIAYVRKKPSFKQQGYKLKAWIKIIKHLNTYYSTPSQTEKNLSQISLQIVALQIYKIYKPFISDFNFEFETKNLKHNNNLIKEKFFHFYPEEIQWKEYWTQNQMEAIYKSFTKEMHSYFQKNHAILRAIKHPAQSAKKKVLSFKLLQPLLLKSKYEN